MSGIENGNKLSLHLLIAENCIALIPLVTHS